jgi:hypothetical protein
MMPLCLISQAVSKESSFHQWQLGAPPQYAFPFRSRMCVLPRHIEDGLVDQALGNCAGFFEAVGKLRRSLLSYL